MNTKLEIDHVLQVPGCIYWKDVDGVYLGCNKAEAELIGLNSPEEVVGKTDYDLPWKNQAGMLREVDQRIMQTGKSEELIESGILTDGRDLIMFTKKSPLFDDKNKIIGTIGVSINITGRKAKEEFGMHQYIGSILQNVPGCIYWKDVNGVYLGCNQAELDILGLKSTKEVIGKTDYDLSWKYHAEILKKTDQRIMCSRVPEEIFENLTSGDGKEIVMLTRKSPLYDNKHNVVGIIGVSIDVTERKEKESLENELRMREKLDTLAKEVIHDMASPVSALMIIKDRYGGKFTKDDLDILNSAVVTIGNMTRKLMEKYRDIEKIRKSKAKPLTREIDVLLYALPYICLYESIKAQRYRLKSDKPGITLNFYPDERNKMTAIKGDHSDFCRMITNLMNNSVEALEDKNGIIDVSFKARGGEVEICVKDNGKGMCEDMVEKINHGIEVGTTKKDGHGIGMQQVRGVVKKMKGKLRVKSQENIGSEFVITFPRVETPEWIAQRIELKQGAIVVIVEEDIEAQEIWEKKFARHRKDLTVIKYFSHEKDAALFILAHEDSDKCFFITEYKFRDYSTDGLILLQNCGVQGRFILTTSNHFPRVEDLDRLIELKGKFLSKLFLDDVLVSVK